MQATNIKERNAQASYTCGYEIALQDLRRAQRPDRVGRAFAQVIRDNMRRASKTPLDIWLAGYEDAINGFPCEVMR